MARVTLGLDLGQRMDFTALVVVEAERRQDARGRREVHHTVRLVERLPLGTSYPDVAARVVQATSAIERKTGTAPILYLDATGLGTPVFDALQAAGTRATIFPVYF